MYWILGLIALLIYTLVLRLWWCPSELQIDWNIKYWFPQYARRIWQAIKWNYTEVDIWGLHSTTAKFLIPRLKLLKEKKHGVPVEFSIYEQDTPKNKVKSLKFIQKFVPEVTLKNYNFDIHAVKAWNKCMDKMITAFELILLEDKGDIDYGHITKDSTKAEYKRYRAKVAKVQRIINEGIMLFAKYYQNLWD